MHEILIKIREVKKGRPAAIGTVIILLLIFLAVAADFIAPHDPVEQNLQKRLLAPSIAYPFGTDELGRCVFSRTLYGTRASLGLGIVVVGISTAIGVVLGTISGYLGGIADEIIMRFVDIVLAFPGIVLALVIAGLLGPGLFNVMIALIMIHWTGYARVIRGTILSVKEKDFIEASKAIGASNFYAIRKHLLPNCINPVIVLSTLGMAHVILSATALSFLGLGAQPPTPEWGSMLDDSIAYMRLSPYLTFFPGIAIMITVMAFNFLGDGLRDAMDIKLENNKYESA